MKYAAGVLIIQQAEWALVAPFQTCKHRQLSGVCRFDGLTAPVTDAQLCVG